MKTILFLAALSVAQKPIPIPENVVQCPDIEILNVTDRPMGRTDYIVLKTLHEGCRKRGWLCAKILVRGDDYKYEVVCNDGDNHGI